MLLFPLRVPYHLTQKFGEHLLDYSQFGMKGHNGLDLACEQGSAVYAADDALVIRCVSGFNQGDPGYGNYISLRVSLDVPNKFYEVIYGHLLQTLVKEGDKVTRGQIIGLVDTTGFSTGNHLHFGVRPYEKRAAVPPEGSITLLGTTYAIPEYNNGYLGYIDPTPLLEPFHAEVLPVDLRYGQPVSVPRETYWQWAYHEDKVRARAIAAGFSAAEFPRMKLAFVYGYWDDATVFDTSMFQLWASITKPEYEKRKQNGTLLGSASSMSKEPQV